MVTVANRRVNVIDIFPNTVRKESRKKVETCSEQLSASLRPRLHSVAPVPLLHARATRPTGPDRTEPRRLQSSLPSARTVVLAREGLPSLVDRHIHTEAWVALEGRRSSLPGRDRVHGWQNSRLLGSSEGNLLAGRGGGHGRNDKVGWPAVVESFNVATVPS
jgi:hypothetical protein